MRIFLKQYKMKKKTQKIWTIIAAVLLSILLLWWLLAATIINEDENIENPVIIQQID